MLVVTKRRGPERCRFGDDVRGLDIYNLELHPEDLMIMLEMDENELKTNIHKILCSMKRSKNYREPRRHPSRDHTYTASDYREQYEQDWSYMADAFSGEEKAAFGTSTGILIKDDIASLPEPSKSGLVWTEEE